MSPKSFFQRMLTVTMTTADGRRFRCFRTHLWNLWNKSATEQTFFCIARFTFNMSEKICCVIICSRDDITGCVGNLFVFFTNSKQPRSYQGNE